MESFRNRLIYLCHLPGITWTQIYKTLKSDPELIAFNYPSPKQLSFLPPVNNDSSQKFFPNFLQDTIRQYTSNGIEVITYFDEVYPSELKEIYQPPWCLFLKGDLSILAKTRKLAVVGARESSSYGKNVILHLLPPLLEKDFVIVSGLAKGIDTLAHQSTIELNGKTIAVIAGGFSYIYPSENQGLAKEIEKEHLILSEYPPYTRPARWHFPTRNRIISGLCEGTIVIEARRKSGSLITANLALQEGREVFSVPGSIFSSSSVGTNELIGQGAKLIMSGEDILAELRT
ncbi:DNA-processing protein DprA [Pseudoneobacillus sp. C159]